MLVPSTRAEAFGPGARTARTRKEAATSTVIQVVLVLLALAALLAAWGLAEGYRIAVERHRVRIPGLPDAYQGQRVALIADLQVGMWLGNTSTIRRTVARIARERPCAALVAGDFVYHAKDRHELAGRAAELLEPLVQAGVPTYAVLGNHDYAMPTKQDPKHDALARAVAAELTRVGVRVLQNESVPLPVPGAAPSDPLYLVGIGAHVPGDDRLAQALAGVPATAPRIVMMHHPNSFEGLPAASAPLAVAGHTHGGQFRIPFTPDWTWMSYTSDDRVHADGFTRDDGRSGNLLYVNRGIGFSVLPLRLNCPPELTWFELQRGDPLPDDPRRSDVPAADRRVSTP